MICQFCTDFVTYSYPTTVISRFPSFSVSGALESEGSRAGSYSLENSLSTSNFSSHRTILPVLFVLNGQGPRHTVYSRMEAIESICVDDGKKSHHLARRKRRRMRLVTVCVWRSVISNTVITDADDSTEILHPCYCLANLLNTISPSKRPLIVFLARVRVCD
jgi:hypothetical protein